MDGESSPVSVRTNIFELPGARTFKPLPKLKRRKTFATGEASTASHNPPVNLSAHQLTEGQLPDPQAQIYAKHHQVPSSNRPPSQSPLKEAEQADLRGYSFLSSYYYPYFSPDFGLALNSFAGQGGSDGLPPDAERIPSTGSFSFNLSPLGATPRMFNLAASQSSDEDEDQNREQDYSEVRDRDRQGNTKKRKVPATQQRGRNNEEMVNTGSGGSEVEQDDLSRTGEYLWIPASTRSREQQAISEARLRIKEMQQIRKRQLVAILGPGTLVESLALDKALATRLPWNQALGLNPEDTLVAERPSRRDRKRRKMSLPALPEEKENASSGLQSKEFTFALSSPASERMVATTEAAKLIRSRFEKEMHYQAQKLIENSQKAIVTSAKGSGNPRTRTSKRNGVVTPSRTSFPSAQGENMTGAQEKTTETPSPNSTKTRGSKKKKRSALANASNPHHLRNYVPSRVLNTNSPSTPTPSQLTSSEQTALSPLPLRFLTADLPPRKGQTAPSASRASAPTTPPTDEWICPFCEYSLFYGDDAGYLKAIRNRKKVLSRRRRARERAAAAASGRGKAKTSVTGINDDVPEQQENPEDQVAKFVDPKVVDERLEASMRGVAVHREKG